VSRTEKLWLLVFVLFAGICSTNWACAQDGNADLPDSPSQVSRSSRHANDPGSDREVSWRSLPKDFLHDQKSIWLFPAQLVKGRYWLPFPAGGEPGPKRICTSHGPSARHVRAKRKQPAKT
jgi:hypothetical protein